MQHELVVAVSNASVTLLCLLFVSSIRVVRSCPQGERAEILLAVAPRRNASGRVTGLIGVGPKITPLLQVQRELKQHCYALEQVFARSYAISSSCTPAWVCAVSPYMRPSRSR